MSGKEFTGVAISTLLCIVVFEVLKEKVSGETLEIIRLFACLVTIAVFTMSCVIWLRKKAWGRAFVCAAVAGTFAFILFHVLLSH